MEDLNLDNLSSKMQNEADQKAIDKALSTKCKKHPTGNAECLYLLPNVQTAKLCQDCIQQEKIPTENYLSIREVLSTPNESDFFSYPILSDPLLHDAIQHNGKDLDSVQQEIDKFRNNYSISEYNIQRLREICNQFSVIRSQFSLEQPNQIRNLISRLLEELNLFKRSNPSPLRAFEQSYETNTLLRKQQELEVIQNQNREAQQKILEYQQIIQELLGEKEIQLNEITSLKHENSLLKQQIDTTSHLGDGSSPQEIKSEVEQETNQDASNPIYGQNFKINLDAYDPTDKRVHYPLPQIAIPINLEPDYTNYYSKSSLKQCGNFIYNSPQFEDSETVELQWHLFVNGQVFKGQWKNGMRHGRGKQQNKDGSIYEGYWQNNMKHGKGRLIYSNGDVYEGEWKNDKANGYGTYKHSDRAKYIGQWLDDKQHGNGIETFSNGAKYEGQYVQSKKQGKGKCLWSDGSQYEGQFLNNDIHGIGANQWADGRNYFGEWKNNKMDGQGEFKWPDGRKYNGNYFDDKNHGYGEFEWADGKKYKGQWFDGKQHGVGVYCDAQGKERSGEWDNGKRIKWNDDN